MTDPETKFRVTKVAKRPKTSTGWGVEDGVILKRKLHIGALHGKIDGRYVLYFNITLALRYAYVLHQILKLCSFLGHGVRVPRIYIVIAQY